jgi:pimeloyl-ACP methyl ester carboxylesterase
MTQKLLKSKSNNPFTSTKKGNLSLKLKLFWLRSGFKIMSCLAPGIAERMALHLFLTPPRHGIPEWQKSYIARAKKNIQDVQGKKITFYQWGSDGPVILLVHGWGGRGSQLGAFIDPLIKAGYRVLALDGPAHGDSSGKSTDMFEFSSAIGTATRIVGAIDTIISHSFGSACSLLAMRENKIQPSKLVLIGCPSSAIWITEDFADKLSISRKTVAGMRKKFEHRYNNRWTWEDLSLLKLIKTVTVPILIVHDRKDLDVPWKQAVELEQANSVCKLFLTEGLGHRRILRSPEVIDRVVSFVQDR